MSSKCLLWTGSACLFLAGVLAALAVCIQVVFFLGALFLGIGTNFLVAAQQEGALLVSGASTVGLMGSPLGHASLLADLPLIPAPTVEPAVVPLEVPRVLNTGLGTAAVPLILGLLCFAIVLRRWQQGSTLADPSLHHGDFSS
jgi:hypothetical protein